MFEKFYMLHFKMINKFSNTGPIFIIFPVIISLTYIKAQSEYFYTL